MFQNLKIPGYARKDITEKARSNVTEEIKETSKTSYC